MKYLVRVVETLRVASEDEAQKVIEAAKKDRNFTLGKYSSEYKCKKVKGEIVEDWYRVTLVKDFTDEKALVEKLNEKIVGTEVVLKLKTSDKGFQNFLMEKNEMPF